MADDPIQVSILDDLREIRRGRGALTLDRVAGAEWLVQDLGRGSVELCYSMLIDFRDRHGSDPASDIGAYYATAGLGLDGESLEQRLRAYADAHFVDPRTALRRSDKGASLLSAIIRDSYIGLRPWAHMSLIQNGPSAQFRLELSIQSGMKWHRPFLWVNGVEIEDRSIFDLHETVQDPERLTAVYTHLPELISHEQINPDALFFINVRWHLPVWPTWSISSLIADPRLYARMTVTRNNSIAVGLDWLPMHDFDRSAPFAFEPFVDSPGFTTRDPSHDGDPGRMPAQ